MTLLTITATLGLLTGTFLFGGLVLVASALGVRHRPGGVYDRAPGWWSRWLLAATGVRVVTHGDEHVVGESAHIFVSNHVSWYDPPALAAVLARCRFVAKHELLRVPLFGAAARRVGTIFIARENRKAAFESYELAARSIRDGSSVVVFPEGTRGASYALRPFKKGPFVLAIASGVPIVPTVVHGTINVNPRGTFKARSGQVDVHFLEPVPTAGLTYDDRDRLSRLVWSRMAAFLREHYGVESAEPDRERADRVA